MPDLADESSDDTDSSYESTDSSTESDSEDYYYHEEPPAGGRHERRRGGGATLVYSADSLKHIKRPHLKFGDDDALDARLRRKASRSRSPSAALVGARYPVRKSTSAVAGAAGAAAATVSAMSRDAFILC